MKKIILLVVLVVVVGGGLGVWWGVHKVRALLKTEENKTAVVDRGPVRQVVTATGSIVPNYEVDIKSKASGIVITVPYDVSDVVKKDALVLELDPIDEKRRVEAAEAALTAAKCRLSSAQQTLEISERTLVTDKEQAEVTLRKAEINAKDARAKAQRSKTLMEKGLESPEAAETAETAALQAEAAVDDAKNAIKALETRPITIESIRNDVKLAETAVKTATTDLEDAQQRFDETKVKAPIDGVVTARGVQVGSIVSSGITNVGGGSSIMTLSDLSRLFVQAPVNEADIGRVRHDQKVVIQCDAFPDKKFEGRIDRIAAKGATQQSVVFFGVKIEVLGEGKELLKPQMTADVEIVVAEREKVLRVPSEAVLTKKKGQRYVLLPANGAATASAPATTTAAASAPASSTGTAPATAKAPTTIERMVKVGADDGEFCEILSGLAEGEKVVLEATGGEWAKLKQSNSED
jgi:HlyD family secretion protein